MAFLEAMAKGKCVVAPNHSTMNEYIIHRKTGILYEPDNPQPLDFSNLNIKEIGSNAREYIEQGHAGWLDAQKELIDFIDQPTGKPSFYKYLLCKVPAAAKKKIKLHFPALANGLNKFRKYTGKKFRRLTKPGGLFSSPKK
jgi:hypothetical protein